MTNLKRHSYYFLLLLFFTSCSLEPSAWNPPKKPKFENELSTNQQLLSAQKIALKTWVGPEDIIFDDLGNLYCGVHKGVNDFSDGKILKISPTGTVEIFYDAGSWVAGLHFDKANNLIALSHKEGLICISPNKEVTVLAKKNEKQLPFLIPNGLDIASDGMIYFSNTSSSSPYTVKYGRKLIMELKAEGGLYQYNPYTKKVRTLINGTYFGNGVVLSKNEDFLLMTETSKYRIIRYWLKGEKQGTSEVFMDNLPGFPNGISIREDGSFWLGFSTCRNDALDNVHAKTGFKKLIYGLPEVLQPKQQAFGMILNISSEGEILNALFDLEGNVIPEAGAVKEFDGHLYIGGDNIPYIGKYKLERTFVSHAKP
ncbi:SMP-30/gluconolactonase/LRE family protein [Sediminitomix flava]|uniref:Gluconolactonase n=1 Tax=Sediminitomix flava TaxID=379075 RepID=A0A315ZD97_SEDFL|nr:SMP-30/gluconolactonase/LRE family protein [Sediminitomix flava]PWJ43099.1 gluconolactonase [Sediminitomix flava]